VAVSLVGEPDLSWATAALRDLCPRSPFLHEERQRRCDPIGGPVSAEQVADGRSRHAGSASLEQSAPNLVGDVVAKCASKDVSRRCLAVFSDGETSSEMRQIDAGAVV
jgi:hypothetical protein